MRCNRIFSSVPWRALDVPVTTTTRWLPVEEANQLRALPVGEPSDRLRLADAAHVEEARRLYPPELRHGHQHVEDLRGRHVLGRVAQDLLDVDAAVLQVLFQLGPPDANVVRSLERFHALVERADRCLGLSLGGHHERRSLTTDTRWSRAGG